MKKYDLIVLGGGTAGLGVVFPAAGEGWKTALVEPAYLGGTCVNVGCIPSKTLISSANAARHVKMASVLGVEAERIRADWTRMVERKDQIITKMRNGTLKSVEKNDNIDFYPHEASFIDSHTISVQGEHLTAKKIVIATGARSAVPPVPGLDDIDYLTSTTLMDLDKLPDQMLILGGGIVALEFAQMLVRLGVEVTVIERAERLAANLDPEISEYVGEFFQKEGIRVLTGSDVKKIWQENHSIFVDLVRENKKQSVSGDRLLVAAGRTPNTDRLNLDSAGIRTDKRGYIEVDEYFRTGVSGVWAIGDVTGGMMFTHKAWHDSVLLANQLLKGEKRTARGRLVPYAVFTDPEIAGVGMGHHDMTREDREVKVIQSSYSSSARAKAMARTDGFITLYTEPDSGKILGVQMVGPEAGETVHEVLAMMRMGGTVHDLQDMMHIHPTLAEMVNIVALSD